MFTSEKLEAKLDRRTLLKGAAVSTLVLAGCAPKAYRPENVPSLLTKPIKIGLEAGQFRYNYYTTDYQPRMGSINEGKTRINVPQQIEFILNNDVYKIAENNQAEGPIARVWFKTNRSDLVGFYAEQGKFSFQPTIFQEQIKADKNKPFIGKTTLFRLINGKMVTEEVLDGYESTTEDSGSATSLREAWEIKNGEQGKFAQRIGPKSFSLSLGNTENGLVAALYERYIIDAVKS